VRGWVHRAEREQIEERSDDAIACWSRLYFSDKSEIGRRTVAVYWMNATSVPSVLPVHMTWRPPYQTISDTRPRADLSSAWEEDRVIAHG